MLRYLIQQQATLTLYEWKNVNKQRIFFWQTLSQVMNEWVKIDVLFDSEICEQKF